MKKLLAALGLFAVLWAGAASAQTACSTQSLQAVLNQFADTAPANSITPQNVRNLACSAFAWAGGGTSIQAFGAKCDGTTDDTTAILAAIAAVTNPGVLTVPNTGSPCLFSSALTITGKTSLAFAPGAQLECTAAAITCLTINEGGNFQGQAFYNVSIIAGGAATSSATTILLLFNADGGGAMLVNPNIQGAAAGKCIQIAGMTYDMEIYGGVVRNCQTRLSMASGASISMLRVRDMIFQTDTGVVSGSNKDMDLINAAVVLIDGVHFIDTATSSGTIVGVDCGDATLSSGGCNGLSIHDSLFEGAYTNYVQTGFGTYSGSATANEIYVEHNHFNTAATGSNVYNFKQTSRVFIGAQSWPGNLIAGKYVTLDSASGPGIVSDSAFNSSFYSDSTTGANTLTYITGQGSTITQGLVSPSTIFAQGGVNVSHLLVSQTAPTINSGFGTSPLIAANNGPAAFTVNVGTGGSASSGVIGLPTATNGWNCKAVDTTTQSANVAQTIQTAQSTSSVTLSSFNDVMASHAWAASDILLVNCLAY